MDFTLNELLIFLAIFSIGAVAVFALVSKKKIEEQKKHDNSQKSTLAKDAPNK